MAEMLSAGVYVTEIDASTIAPTVSSSIGVFAGNFDKGPVEDYILVTSVAELITFFGEPNDVNYNDWYQAYNFLQYGNKLYLARAANTGGTATPIAGEVLVDAIVADTTADAVVTLEASYTVGSYISFGDTTTNKTFYEVLAVVDNAAVITVTVDRLIEDDLAIGAVVNDYIASLSGVVEAVDSVAAGEAVTADHEYLGKYVTIKNFAEFEELESSIAFTNVSDSKLKFIARSPGDWSSKLEIAIALPADFITAEASYVFDGIVLNDLFEYYPTGTEVGIVIRLDDVISEIFTVDFDMTAKDNNSKSTYVESVINNQSSLVFVKDNTGNADPIKSYIYGIDTAGTGDGDGPLSLVLGMDSIIQADDLMLAYELWENKETLSIDIVIANELAPDATRALVDARKDCIGFIGANYADTVGKKASIAVANLVTWRKTGDLNYNNMFIAAFGSYKYIYDRYSDKNRWVNIAGDCAGLRAQTSSNRASWWASAGQFLGLGK